MGKCKTYTFKVAFYYIFCKQMRKTDMNCVRSRSQFSNSTVYIRSACRMQGAYRIASFEFLAAALLKTHAVLNSTPPGLVNIYRRFGGSHRPHLHGKEGTLT